MNIRNFSLCLVIVALFFPVTAGAQESRVQELEEAVQSIQRRLYRQDAQKAPKDEAEEGDSISSAGVDRLQSRVDELEDVIRALTGRLEEMSHTISTLRTRVQKEGAAKPSPAAGPPKQLATPVTEEDGNNGGEVDGEPLLPDEDTSASAAGKEDDQSPEGLYNKAYNLLKQGDYDRAETLFSRMVKEHPDHQLAPNAQYWLGETHFVRGDYKRAAVAFADGLEKYPEGAKGAANLLKMGMSFAHLDRTEKACEAFRSLTREYPNAPETVNRRVTREMLRAGCESRENGD